MPKGEQEHRVESKFAEINYKSSQDSPPHQNSLKKSNSVRKKSNSPIRIKKATAVVNSSRDRKGKIYESVKSPKLKYEGRYDKTPLSKYDNSTDKRARHSPMKNYPIDRNQDRYSPLKNYQTKAQNVMGKYGTKPSSKIVGKQ